MRAAGCPLQVNARKIYDEADVLGGILDNKLFLGILGAEAALQVVLPSQECTGLTFFDASWHFRICCTIDQLFRERHINKNPA